MIIDDKRRRSIHLILQIDISSMNTVNVNIELL
jgi:hypothetical protein